MFGMLFFSDSSLGLLMYYMWSVSYIYTEIIVCISFLQSAEHGVFKEVMDLKKTGRLQYIVPAEMMVSPDTLLQDGDYVLAAEEPLLKMLVHFDASKKGKHFSELYETICIFQYKKKKQ